MSQITIYALLPTTKFYFLPLVAKIYVEILFRSSDKSTYTIEMMHEIVIHASRSLNEVSTYSGFTF